VPPWQFFYCAAAIHFTSYNSWPTHFVKSLTKLIHFGMVLHRYRKLNIFTMYYTTTMSAFEAEKNRKAFTYTTVIVITLLLIAIFGRWQLPLPPQPPIDEAIEINLGNLNEGLEMCSHW